MISRAPLPPPPPEIRSWSDQEARLAVRDGAMAELARRGLSAVGLVLLWLLGAVAVVGWAALGLAVRSVETGGLAYATAPAALILGLFLLGAAGVGLALWASRGREVRRRLADWAGVGPVRPDLVTHRRLRATGRCAAWLLPSVALCLLGLRAALPVGGRLMTASEDAVAAQSLVFGDVVYAAGMGATLLLTGVLGLIRSVDHQRWAARYLRRIPDRRGGGAHR
ncbi:hypothetical protein [Streptomyces corynorhini]|uniref:Uncharacterized protein n=1 Tax=Streptomyces corynorhini TaxID=2282652 RepID=A0A370B694_9ACTN|nr:hypothetical protein [Streptomyces corynorhini]RDG35604.1 hypothetical protein DVH02_24435 [Streptomyces corynorhini]